MSGAVTLHWFQFIVFLAWLKTTVFCVLFRRNGVILPLHYVRQHWANIWLCQDSHIKSHQWNVALTKHITWPEVNLWARQQHSGSSHRKAKPGRKKGVKIIVQQRWHQRGGTASGHINTSGSASTRTKQLRHVCVWYLLKRTDASGPGKPTAVQSLQSPNDRLFGKNVVVWKYVKLHQDKVKFTL